MRIATWNVNSIRAREERALAFLERHRPDLVCLQELKTETDAFPYESIERAGYYCAVHGQRTYNGVAILSRKPLDDVLVGWPDGPMDPQARIISAVWDAVRVVCVYVPNGKSVGSESWSYKIEWLRRLEKYLGRPDIGGGALVLCGDFNIAPGDDDIAFPERWDDTVLSHEDVRSSYRRMIDAGLVDVVRRQNDPPGPYTWWDYRQLAFPKGDGLRIDHILADENTARKSTEAWVDRDERKGSKPSDHAPVFAVFDLS